MYKKQLRFQKFACMLALIAAAVSFVYSLGVITDIFDALYLTMRNPADLTDTKVPGSIIYYDMQDFNKLFVNASIGLILLACLLFLTNTQVRRRYYIGNFVSIGLYSAGAIAVTLWSHQELAAFANQYKTTVDFEALKEYAERWDSLYTESTFMLDLHYFVGGLCLLAVCALVGSMIWKIVLMRAEKKLLSEAKEVTV